MKTRTLTSDIRICVDKVERVEHGKDGKWHCRVTAENAAYGFRFLLDDLNDAPKPGEVLVIKVQVEQRG